MKLLEKAKSVKKGEKEEKSHDLKDKREKLFNFLDTLDQSETIDLAEDVEDVDGTKDKKNGFFMKIDDEDDEIQQTATKNKRLTNSKGFPLNLTSKKTSKKRKKAKGRIIGFFGRQGTGKSKRSLDIAKLGNVLYIDTEDKAHEVLEEYFQAELIHSDDETQYFQYKTEWDTIIDLFVVEQLNAKFETDKRGTVQYFLKNLDMFLSFLKEKDYNAIVIDNCSIFRDYGKDEWLNRNPKRTRPQSYEYGEIEAIAQECLMPLIHLGKKTGKYVILCYDIKDKYLNDTVVGETEDAKFWILRLLSYELWLEWDFKIYVLKHPYKPFWEYQDEDENFYDYIFDKKFIDNDVTFKPYIQFYEETLVSEEKRQMIEEQRESSRLTIGD